MRAPDPVTAAFAATFSPRGKKGEAAEPCQRARWPLAPERRDRLHGRRHRTEKPFRWHILVFLAPAVLVYSADHDHAALRHAAAVAVPRSSTGSQLRRPRQFPHAVRRSALVGRASGARCGTIAGSSSSTCWCRTRSACCSPRCCRAQSCGSRAFYRTAIFVPTILSFVIVGFVWKLILSPLWGISPHLSTRSGFTACSAAGSARKSTR